MAITLYPSRAKSRARVPARVVFPTPPFPEMAILMVKPPGLDYRSQNSNLQIYMGRSQFISLLESSMKTSMRRRTEDGV